MILPALVAEQCAALLVAAETLPDQVVGEATGSVGDLCPREPAISMDQADLVRSGGSDCLVDVGDRELLRTHTQM